MPVSDEQVAALRAFLQFDPSSERLARDLATESRADGFGDLVHAAFVLAVRRWFGSSWTSADVIKFVAAARINLRNADLDLQPKTAEALIRGALGELGTAQYSAHTFLLILEVIAAEQHLGTDALTDFLIEARKVADTWMAERSQTSGEARQTSRADN